ncbi:hypothetical protein ACQY0O_005715 [Thecaphora frezii]
MNGTTPFPALPQEQLIKRLNSVAPHFYTKPETADCIVIVPVPIAALPAAASRSLSAAPSVAPTGAARSSLLSASPLWRSPKPTRLAAPGPGSRIFDKRHPQRTVAAHDAARLERQPPQPEAAVCGSESNSSRASSISTATTTAQDLLEMCSSTISTPRTECSAMAAAVATDDERVNSIQKPTVSQGSALETALRSAWQQRLASTRRGSAPTATSTGTDAGALQLLAPHRPADSSTTTTTATAAAADEPSSVHTTPALPSNNGRGRHLVFRLHRDYLVSQSTLLRSLLDGAKSSDGTATASSSPMPASDDVNRQKEPASAGESAAASAKSSVPSSSSDAARAATEAALGGEPERRPSLFCASSGSEARLVSSVSGPATVYLPLPDPASFWAVVHYLYHGDFGVIARLMQEGRVRWEGIVVNADYLGLDRRLRAELGLWWSQRRQFPSSVLGAGPCGEAKLASSPFQGFRFGGGTGLGASSVFGATRGKRTRYDEAECLSPRTVVGPLGPGRGGLAAGAGSGGRWGSHLAIAADVDGARGQGARRCTSLYGHGEAGEALASAATAAHATRPGGVAGVAGEVGQQEARKGRTRAFTMLINNLVERRCEQRPAPRVGVGRLRSRTVTGQGAAPTAKGM